MSTNMWGADPEKYKKLSEPVESVEKAQELANGFMGAVKKIRELYNIPDLIVRFTVYAKQGDGVVSLAGGAGWGDQIKQAKLAKAAADSEFNHLFNMLARVVNAFPETEDEFLTDPVSDGVPMKTEDKRKDSE